MVSFQTIHRKLKAHKEKNNIDQNTPSAYISTRGVICPYCKYEHDDSIQQSGVALCGNCGQNFQVQLKREKTGKIIRREHEEFVKSFTTYPIIIAPKIDVEKINSIEQLTELVNKKLISVEQARDITVHRGWDIPFWNLAKERNPFSPEGDNKSREMGFTYNCHRHPIGKYFQWVIKPSILRFIDLMYGTARALYGKERANWFKRQVLKLLLLMAPNMIEFANKTMQTQYDKDAFIFDDPFLVALRNLLYEHIETDFQHNYPRKDQFMRKGVDVSLATMKEDIFYRGRVKLIVNDLIKRYPDGFPLTDAEKANIISGNEEARIEKERMKNQSHDTPHYKCEA